MSEVYRVIFREPNGQVTRMDAYASYLSWFVRHMGFINKDPAHSATFKTEWADRTDPRLSLAPECDGFILLDQKSDTILSVNGLSFNSLSGLSVAMNTHDGLVGEDKELGSRAFHCEHTEDAYALGQFLDANRVNGVYLPIPISQRCDADGWMQDIPVDPSVDIKGMSLDQLTEWVQRCLPPGREHWCFSLDMAPYQHRKSCDITSNTAQFVLSELERLSFDVTKKDRRAWASYIKELEEC